MDRTERPRAGRKRSEESRQAILDAALAMLRERGYGKLTTDVIAEAAGVGKQTIYRWWRSKAEVVLEALNELARTDLPDVDTGDLEADLASFLASMFRLLRGPKGTGVILKGLMADAQLDADFAVHFTGFIEGRRASLRGMLERARRRGAMREDAPLDALVDMLFGAMWYRLLVGHAPLDAAFARALAELATRGAV